MTCYQRHLESLFESLGVDYDMVNRSLVDAAIRELLGLGKDAHCPEVWASIKALSTQDRESLPARVAERL